MEEQLRLFTERLHDYGAVVYHCAERDIRDTVAQVLAVRGKHGLIVPAGISKEWLPDAFLFVRDEALNYDDIDRSEGVLTGCAVAIALTGTVVLRHSAAEGRRAITLVPDYHLCIVRAGQVVETVPEGIREMAKYSGAPLTTISGPSATSDIEMTRIKGVHGPRTLDVIVAVD
ncbi:MAG: LUD domain-containing protein [Verrucomicrobia bacterium]|nr:LUD domain-containing protein [Verrucomicrobiota bacterium]